MSQSGNLIGTYTYNGREQLATRVITNSGSANGTTYFVHDQWGNIIAELDATGSTVREYIWMPEAEIAPTRGSRTTVDRPVAVVSNVATTPALLMVHVDQLNRPVKMTDATGAVVWSALYSPFGGAYTLSGAETLNARFPGQWFQLEAGLHYNWHRHYDPSLGRYTQPDPLGFIDGPSVFAYGRSSPEIGVDLNGLETAVITGGPVPGNPFGHTALACTKCGVHSFGTRTPPGSSTSNYVTSQSRKRDQTIQILPTTPDEEKCIRDYLNTLSPNLPDTLLTTDTCACRTLEALRRCTSFDLSGVGCMFPASTFRIIQRSTTRTLRIPKGGPPPNLFDFNK
ncbi:MAG: RHS repeat-associated core domain-containing protein [Hyphomicrobiaceae bacterium]